MDAGRGAATNYKSQAGVQFVGMIVSAFGGIADVFDRQLQMKILQLGSTSNLNVSQRYVSLFAKGALYSGAVILAGVEFYKAYNAFQKEQYILTGLYSLNGFFVFYSHPILVISKFISVHFSCKPIHILVTRIHQIYRFRRFFWIFHPFNKFLR